MNAPGVTGCIAAATLAGCGVLLQPPTAPLRTSNDIYYALPNHRTFHYTGKKQSFKVPAGVSSLTVVALGAAGEPSPSQRTFPGRGGRVYAIVPVQPGERLYIFVGGAGFAYYQDGDGGFNGGGTGGGLYEHGYGGGGASDVREAGDKLTARIVVAGGGGGGGGGDGGGGGAGGGSIGGAGFAAGSGDYGGGGGGGGTQTAGGTAGRAGKTKYDRRWNGRPGKRGRSGVGGEGGNGGYGEGSSSDGLGGGGGGGGYFGGGGGGGGSGGEAGSSGGGGGGGSSYVEPSATASRFWQGWKSATGNGLVVFSWQ